MSLIRGWTKHLTPPVAGWQRTDPLDRGLIGEWRFDQDTGLLLPDYSGYINHGDIQSGTSWVVRPLGQALQFDDNAVHFVQVSALGPVDILYPMTIEFFGYIREDSFDGYFIAMRDGAQQQWAVRRVGFTVALYTYNGNDGDSTAAALQLPGWDALHHIVVTLDGLGTTATFYADGQDVTNDGAVAAPTNATSDVFIGVRGDGAGGGAFPVDADFLLVRLYNRVLSAAEVRARYQICLRRGQALTHTWMMPWGAVTAVRIPRPPAAYNTLAIYG